VAQGPGGGRYVADEGAIRGDGGAVKLDGGLTPDRYQGAACASRFERIVVLIF